MDDDDDWQDMPIIHSARAEEEEEDRRKQRFVAPQRLDLASNATGMSLETEVKGDWREKGDMDERDYTRLELDDDPDEDEVHLRTQYLFDDDKEMTPLSQMQATKQLLNGTQRVAYVGLCRLVTREMVQSLRLGRHKELEVAAQSTQNWATKIMGRLYHHMEISPPEQRMIEQLAEHGVTAMDLTPSLITTHVVANPEYDPRVAREAEAAASTLAAEADATAAHEVPPPPYDDDEADIGSALDDESTDDKDPDAFPEGASADAPEASTAPPAGQRTPTMSPRRLVDDYAEQADVADSDSPRPRSARGTPSLQETPRQRQLDTPRSTRGISQPPTPSIGTVVEEHGGNGAEPGQDNLIQPLPHTLPGVSTSLTAADKTVTLDIRWTILCDLFLALIADSVYDARSRVLLGAIAERLGLSWTDVVRFERRLTDALEISESVREREHNESIEDRRKRDAKRRYVMMGAAALGGGLVIGLSAGLLAPVIGAGLGAAFTTIGVTGTTGFLAGAGGAAIITTGGVLTGANIAGRGMARRTRSVKTFRFLPLHNNKRVSCYIAVPGFMNGHHDDVRLPFSVLDPVIGDVFSVLWEPEMMGETGNAIRILTSEVLTQVGQQVLQATVLTALMSALQWPIILTKLGYLIDNPWSNALDRAKSAGALLADILIKRDVGVRPVSLIGFSLGARVIFYALVELARLKAFGIIQDVYLMGATVTANNKTWRSVSGIVSGRFVNAYARNDWVLAYLFRATSGGIGTVAGLRPVESIPNLENIDVTEIVVGHMSYRTTMPILLQTCGFKVTRDTFDELEDLSEMPDREIVTEEEQARRDAEKAEKKKGLFKFKKQKPPKPGSSSGPRSGQPMSRGQSSESTAPRTSLDTAASSTDADDDLPPREEGPTFNVEALREEVAKMADANISSESLPLHSVEPPALPQRSVSFGPEGSPSISAAHRVTPPPSIDRLPSPEPPVRDADLHHSPDTIPVPNGSDYDGNAGTPVHEDAPPPLAPSRDALPQWELYAQPTSSVISFAGDDGEITSFDTGDAETWTPKATPTAADAWRNPW